MNILDIILTIAAVCLIAFFYYIIIPYIRCIKYIENRRRVLQKLKKLREMVEKRYDFK